MIDLVIDFGVPLQKQGLYGILKDLKGEYVIKIKKRSRGRSIQENRYYWGVCLAYIEDYTGVDKAILHDVFKNRFIPLVKFADDYRLTTTDLTHEQVWEFINMVRLWAKDFLGLAIPDPDGVIL